jgi:hypothetical protein
MEKGRCKPSPYSREREEKPGEGGLRELRI